MEIEIPEAKRLWLAERKNYLGSSDIAAVLGVRLFDKSRSALDVYLDKITPEILLWEEDTEQMYWGNLLEPVIADDYARREKVELQDTHNTITKHPEIKWMGVSIDRFVSDGRILEIKTAGHRMAYLWGEEGSDDIPQPYIIQAQDQMVASGALICDIAVLIGGQEYRQYQVQRNEDLIAVIIDKGEQFWKRVENREPPAADWGWDNEQTLRLLKKIWPPRKGERRDLKDSTDSYDLALALRTIREKAKELKDKETEIKSRLVFTIGCCEYADLPGGWSVQRQMVHKKTYSVAEHDEERLMVYPPKELAAKKKKGVPELR